MFYILKVWICTCLLASMITLLILNSNSFASFRNLNDFASSYILFVIMNLLFSIPTFIVLSVIKIFFNKKGIPLKIIFNIIGVLGVIVSLYVVFGNSFIGNSATTFVLPYSVSISIFIWLFKLE